MKIFIKIGIGVSLLLNGLVIGATSYVWLNSEKRFNENREWLKGQIKTQVEKQIRESMPIESGGVNVGNK